MDEYRAFIQSEVKKTNIIYKCHILTHSRKMILMNLFTGQQWRHRHSEQTCGHRVGGEERFERMKRVAWKPIHQ